MTVAICYFGLTRSTKICYKSHIENINNVLDKNNTKYHIFLHTWEIKNGIQKVWNRTIKEKIDYDEYKFLNPSFFKRESQADFLNNIDFTKFFYKDVADKFGLVGNGEWIPDLIKNHLCALESQRRVYEMVQNSNNIYDHIIIVRPDSLILNTLPYNDVALFLNNNPKGIALPNFDKCEGYNDRFAILNYEYAEKYCSRINEIADFRKHNGRITSEKYVKFICDKYYDKVLFLSFTFKLLRPSDTIHSS
jgi:hypothetical protein